MSYFVTADLVGSLYSWAIEISCCDSWEPAKKELVGNGTW